jgi:O-antigen/teichoic acid export membrane protein
MTTVDFFPVALATRWARAFPAGSLRQRLARGAAWSLAATCATQGTALLASILTARLLGRQDFGRLGLIRSTVLVLGVLAGTGLGMAATKYVAELRDLDGDRAGRLLALLLSVAAGMSAAVTVPALLFAGPLARHALGDPTLAGALRTGALLLVLTTVGGVLMGTLAGFEAFREVAWLSLAEGVLGLLAIVAGAWAFGVAGAVGGSVAASALTLPLKWVTVRRVCRAAGIRVSPRECRGELRALWTFVLPSILVGVSFQPAEWGARLLLARQPHGFDQLGLFTASVAWSQFVTFLPAQLMGAAMPVLAHTYAAGNMRGFRRVLGGCVAGTLGAGLLAALPLALLSGTVMSAYGAGFGQGARVLVVVALTTGVAVGTQAFRAALAATGRMWWQTAHTAMAGGVLMVAAALLTARGAMGLAWAYAAANAAFFVIQAAAAVAVARRQPSAAPATPSPASLR